MMIVSTVILSWSAPIAKILLVDQQLPQNEDARRAGPISLHSPVDDELHSQEQGLELDTTLPGGGQPRRKRHADCCVCCGLRYAPCFHRACLPQNSDYKQLWYLLENFWCCLDTDFHLANSSLHLLGRESKHSILSDNARKKLIDAASSSAHPPA